MTATLAMPPTNQTIRQTPIARLLFERFEREGVDKKEVADMIGMRPATFNAKLNGQTFLHQSRKKDVDFILQVCQKMNWDAQELMAEAAKMGDDGTSPDLVTLDIFLDALSDPTRPKEQREVARAKVKEMFLDKN